MYDKETKYQTYPNIARVAQELARCENPDKVLSAMLALLECCTKNPANSG